MFPDLRQALFPPLCANGLILLGILGRTVLSQRLIMVGKSPSERCVVRPARNSRAGGDPIGQAALVHRRGYVARIL